LDGGNIREQSALSVNPAMLDGSSRPGIWLHYQLLTANWKKLYGKNSCQRL